MKYLLLLLIIAVVAVLLGFKRSRPRAPAPTKHQEPLPKDMVACAHCGLHLPRDEALPGRGGQFCSAAHRQAYESAHTP